MRYRTIKVSFKDYPKRLKRTLTVREDVDLFTLGLIILDSLKAMFHHYFYFKTKDQIFLPENFENLWNEKSVFMTNYHLLDLGEKCTLVYDTGDWYEFEIKIAKEAKEIRSRRFAFIEKAVGAGIFEDNIRNLHQYFDGEISGDTKKDNRKKEIFMPWNLQIESYADYDLAPNLELMNEELQDEIEYLLYILEEQNYF